MSGNPTRDPATDVGSDRTLTQPTPNYHEDEAVELEMIKMSLEQAKTEDGTLTQPTSDYHEDDAVELQMAINMSLGQSNAETTKDSSGNYALLHMEEQAELDQPFFLLFNSVEEAQAQWGELLSSLESTRIQMKGQELTDSAMQLITYFEQSGDCAAIDDAVQLFREVANLIPDGHPEKAGPLNNLGTALKCRFERLGEQRDIEDAIRVMQQTIDLTPVGHAPKAGYLNNLGTAFLRRFEHLGELGDIENAIQVMRQAVDLPDGDFDKAALFSNLGIASRCRFERLGEVGDIEYAIQVMRQAVDLTPVGHANKSRMLSNLGSAFFRRFMHLGELGDMENAIQVIQQAVNLTPDGHAVKALQLNNLGNAIQCRFEHLGEVEDLGNAIQLLQQAVDLTPDGHADKAGWLSNLGGAFQRRFEHLGELGDIENSIWLRQQAIDLTPDGHAAKASLLNNLGGALHRRFQHLGELGDIQHTISTYQQAAKHTSGTPSIRYTTACVWASLSSQYQGSSSALDAYKMVLEIIPRLVWLGQTVHRRYEELPKIGRTINAAVATAISVGDLTQAVEWLEEGRGIVWGQILQLRSPLDDLHDQHPVLAKDLEMVSKALQNAGTSIRSNFIDNSNTNAAMTGEQEAQHHTKLATEYEALIAKVRTLDGFDSFLKPKKLSALTPAIASGPIIIINVDQSHCDALVLSSLHDIIHISLPNFSSTQAEELHSALISSLWASGVRVDRNGDRVMRPVKTDNKLFKSVLAHLWSNVVQPILSRIDNVLCDYSAEDCLPHITWCATGALAFLPIHAAGIYGSQNASDNIKLSDFAVSSYTTTLSAMLNSGGRIKRDPMQNQKVLIVSQPATPDLPPLPGTTEEARIIQKYTSPEHSCHLAHDQAVVETVKSEMSKYEIVHLACHGIQDPKTPLDSAFALYNGRLRLQDLMGLSLENAELAFLSACQTAAGDENLPEEAVHLAAGMLAVGYPSVIATMWSIGDKDAPIVADKVYKRLLGRCDKSVTQNPRQSTAYALHAAVEHLRKEVGEMEFVKWVPFVHYGV